jgi:cytochrome c6
MILFFYLLNINDGKNLFAKNCNACHFQGTNIIIPEKNLQKKSLERNGINTFESIVYQITNGKNGMPAFGGRLSDDEIYEIAKYVIQQEKEE